jgi:2-keto-4-pentenoate hydratase
MASARRSGRLLIAEDLAIIDAQAYDVQGRLHRALRNDSPVVGFKLGYTSDVMRKAMGISHPNYGPLTEEMVMTSPACVGSLMQPKVEPEFAVIVGRDSTIGAMHASVEVVDSVWADYRFTWAHNTADGSSAAFAVVGEEIPKNVPLADITIEMTSSSGESSVVRAQESGIDVKESLRWLFHQSDVPRAPEPQDVVLTGGLAAPLDLVDGGWIEATFRSASWVTRVRVERDES